MKIYTLTLLFIFLGCVTAKNEFNKARFKSSRFSITPNKNKDYVKIVDTSAFYMAVLSKEFIQKYNLENFKNGIKFYPDGKIGHFKEVDINNLGSLNPKKATMGYYNFDDGINFYIEDINPIPSQVGVKYHLSKSKILINSSSMDTLVLKSFKSAVASEGITKYIKVKLPKEALELRPDW